MNVISLSHYRLKRTRVGTVILLVCDPDSHLQQELKVPWSIIPITDEASLGLGTPDFFIVDTTLEWVDPFELTRRLSKRSPFIWLAPQTRRKQKGWIKRAYAAGVSDIFYSPFELSEISEALRLILRLQRFG